MSRTARTIVAPATFAIVMLVAGSAVVIARAPTAPHIAPIPAIPEAGATPLPPVPPPAIPAVPTSPRPPEAPARLVPGETMRGVIAEAQNARISAMRARAKAQIAVADARRAALAEEEGARRRMLDDSRLALNQARASIAAAEGMRDADRHFALERIDRALAYMGTNPSGR